jgi:biopolymer transport protein ExbD
MKRQAPPVGLTVRLRPPVTVHVSVLPMINVFLTLIPFLLLCANLAPLAATEIGVPQRVAPRDAAGPAVTLRIRPRLFEIDVDNGKEGSEGQARHMTVPRNLEDAGASRTTYAALVETFHRLKRRYPNGDTVTVRPDDVIPYEEVVATMDSLRDIITQEQGVKRRAPLFPGVILGAQAP